jgi:hypothetical protein
MVDMHQAIRLIQRLESALADWVEIADEEDIRESDLDVMCEARVFLHEAGVEVV